METVTIWMKVAESALELLATARAWLLKNAPMTDEEFEEMMERQWREMKKKHWKRK